VLSRKAEVERLEKEGEEGMVHSLLSGLPNISDEESSFFVKKQPLDSATVDSTNDPDNTRPDEDAGDRRQYLSVPGDSELLEETVVKQEPTSTDLPGVNRLSGNSPISKTEESVDSGNRLVPSGGELSPAKSLPEDPHPSNLYLGPFLDPAIVEEILEDEEKQASAPSSSHSYHRYPSVSLTSLLTQADLLCKSYPPTHSSIALSTIMGPQSTIFTWSEFPMDMPDDDEAERMVDKPELIVRPYIEVAKEQDSMGEKRRKRQKLGKSPFGRMEKRTMVAGAVVVLGVALAVYGVRTRGPGLFQSGDAHGHGKDWRRFGRWVSGVLVRGY
jgi:hypothetical protein